MLNLKRLQMGKKSLWTVHRLNQETITKQKWVPENVKATLPPSSFPSAFLRSKKTPKQLKSAVTSRKTQRWSRGRLAYPGVVKQVMYHHR